MAPIGETLAALRFFGEDLDPAEITALLQGAPTDSAVKGDLRVFGPNRTTVEKVGKWLRDASPEKPGNLPVQIEALLGDLTSDLAVWRDLSSRFTTDIYVGAFMAEVIEGFTLPPETLALLADRGLKLSVEIYAPCGDDVI